MAKIDTAMNKPKNNFSSLHNEQILGKVIDFLRPEKPGRLLDVGAGNGYLCHQLADLGFSVFACDIQPEQFQATGIPIKKVDLNTKLPYPKNSFHYLTCTEVIEHLENPWHFCREMARILKKKGVFILSLPNFTNLISRCVFFARGNFRLFDEWVWQHWGHINPITFTELNLILKSTGFKIEAIQTQAENEQPYAFLLRLSQKTLSFVFHLFKLMRQADDRQDKALKTLETRPLLFGENLIIKCKKS